MSSFDHASSDSNGNDWLGITGILSIPLAVVFALAVAAIVYLNWSSNAALSEFMATGTPSASEQGYLAQPAPLQQVKSRMACAKRA